MVNSSFYCACTMTALCAVGVCGNALSVSVFSRRSMRSSSINVLLTALSLIDLLLVILIVPIFAVPALNVGAVNEFSHVMVVYMYPLGMMLQTASVWLFMVITVERYLAVVHPLRVGLYCSPTRATLAISVVVISAIAYNCVRFWEYSLQRHFDPSRQRSLLLSVGLLRDNTNYWLWYGTVSYLLTQFLLPFVLMAVLNTWMVRTMVTAKRRRSKLTISEKCEHRTALMMVIVVVTFASCYTLSFVLNFIELLDPTFFVRQSTRGLAFLLNDISNTLVTANSASTFLVYTAFSRRYRFFVKLLFISVCPQFILRRVVEEETIEAVQMNKLRKERSVIYTSRRALQPPHKCSHSKQIVSGDSTAKKKSIENGHLRKNTNSSLDSTVLVTQLNRLQPLPEENDRLISNCSLADNEDIIK